MTKAECFAYRYSQLLASLLAAVEDVEVLNANMGEWMKVPVEEGRSHARNAMEHIRGIQSQLANLADHTERVQKGYVNKLKDSAFIGHTPLRRYEDNSHMFQSDE